ncbi:MAG: thioredoxin domain-containing protein [Proteobacteria bacterium]|nr:thioredoxin domain-containing protein [Pseudomonadota bacterium]
MKKYADKKTEQNKTKKGRVVLLISLVLCIVGLGVAIELTKIHYFSHTKPDYSSVCAISENINCETVAQSPFSVFIRAPVSVWGIFGYTLIGFMAIWGLTRKSLHPTWPHGTLLVFYAVSTIASVMLGYISVTKIDSLCLFCATLYTINLALFILGVVSVVQLRASPLRLLIADLKALFSRLRVSAVLIIVAGGAVTALNIAIPPYWQHPGWTELPSLTSGEDNGCHWIGAKNPIVTVVEFSDYQCPHCRKAHKEMRGKAAQYPDEVRLIHNHLPLDNACNAAIKRPFHNRACEFSKAAECAAEQGKFWEMNDALFSIQDKIPTRDVNVARLAVQIGLDRSAFNQCMADEGIPDCILKDLEKARFLDVEGTPTFFIGSQSYPGRIPDGALEMAVAAAQQKQKK